MNHPQPKTATLTLTRQDRDFLDHIEAKLNLPDTYRLSYYLMDCDFVDENVFWWDRHVVDVLLTDHERAVLALMYKNYPVNEMEVVLNNKMERAML